MTTALRIVHGTITTAAVATATTSTRASLSPRHAVATTSRPAAASHVSASPRTSAPRPTDRSEREQPAPGRPRPDEYQHGGDEQRRVERLRHEHVGPHDRTREHGQHGCRRRSPCRDRAACSAISISSTTVTAPTSALNNSPTIGWTPNSQYSPPRTVLKPGGQRAVGPPVNGTYPSPWLRLSAVLWYMSASLNGNPLRSTASTQATRSARASVNSTTCGNHLRATSERSRPRDTTGIVAARTASGAGSQRVGSLNGSTRSRCCSLSTKRRVV